MSAREGEGVRNFCLAWGRGKEKNARIETFRGLKCMYRKVAAKCVLPWDALLRMQENKRACPPLATHDHGLVSLFCFRGGTNHIPPLLPLVFREWLENGPAFVFAACLG